MRPIHLRSAREILEERAKALGGRKAGSGWMARRCSPAHDDRRLCLSVSGGLDDRR